MDWSTRTSQLWIVRLQETSLKRRFAIIMNLLLGEGFRPAFDKTDQIHPMQATVWRHDRTVFRLYVLPRALQVVVLFVAVASSYLRQALRFSSLRSSVVFLFIMLCGLTLDSCMRFISADSRRSLACVSLCVYGRGQHPVISVTVPRISSVRVYVSRESTLCVGVS